MGAVGSESAEVEGEGVGVWRSRGWGLEGVSVEIEGVGVGGSESVEVEGVGGGGSGSVEVEGEAGGSGSVEVEGEGAGGSGSVGVEGEKGDDECGLPSTSEDAGTVRKRRRLSAIGAMVDEPVQSWLDNLPQDDLQHMALLLYGRLPTIFGLSKTDTAAVVGEVLHKNERTIRRWVDDFMSVLKQRSFHGRGWQSCDVKYPPSQGYHHALTTAAATPHSRKILPRPGGKQPKIGQPQTMTLPDGRPKGAALVLEERGYNTKGMKLEAILADNDDFKNEKCRVDTFLSNSGHTCVFIPKFHCELNPIERVWSQRKRYTRAYCDYAIGSRIPLGLKSVSKDNIVNYVHRCGNYMFAYLEGSAVGQELEKKIKFYKSQTYSSHRRVGIND